MKLRHHIKTESEKCNSWAGPGGKSVERGEVNTHKIFEIFRHIDTQKFLIFRPP
jgi:hypothetical protein